MPTSFLKGGAKQAWIRRAFWNRAAAVEPGKWRQVAELIPRRLL